MSFKDSKIAAAANSAMTLSAELAVDTEEYTLCTDGRYEVYTKYQDNAYSTVDNLKNIAVDVTQINIMQEENSQYMPFRIPRYWDGMDLMDMLIQIRYESVAEKKGKVATVINVASNNTYIRFGWLIDAAVTANAGDIIFEIMATGVNEKGNNYIWRTRPNGKFTVLEGLNYDGIIEPSEDWYTSIADSMFHLCTKLILLLLLNHIFLKQMLLLLISQMMIPERKQILLLLRSINLTGPDLQMLQLQTGCIQSMKPVEHMGSLIQDRILESYLCSQFQVRGNHSHLIRRISHVL